jgi:hypothetical protein
VTALKQWSVSVTQRIVNELCRRRRPKTKLAEGSGRWMKVHSDVSDAEKKNAQKSEIRKLTTIKRRINQ